MREPVETGHWHTAGLSVVVEVTKGKKPPSLSRAADNVLPYLEASYLRGQSCPRLIEPDEAAALVTADDVDSLILWDGANAGEVFRAQRGVVASTMARARPKTPGLLPDYLYFFLLANSQRLRETAAGSTVPHVRASVLRDLQVPLPPLPVQDRVVQVLRKADDIRRKRREALELADAILPALFISMFGDPDSSGSGFERIPLGDLADIRPGVTKGRNLQGKETVEVPYLRVANVQEGFLDLSEVKTIGVLSEDVDKYRLEDGDILMTEGGDPDKLGRGSVWQSQVEGCIHQNHVFRVRANREKLAPEYLAALLRTQYAKHYFLSCAKRSSNLASVNSTQVRAFPIPVPPIRLQRKFVGAVQQWVRASGGLAKGLKGAGRLFASVIQEAFTGRLTAEWEAANGEWIAEQQVFHERLPRLLLLALLAEHRRRTGFEAAGVSGMALMSYMFLLQTEGNTRRSLYHFVPYRCGPFAQGLQTDLERLQEEGLARVTDDTEGDGTRVTLTDSGKVEQMLTDLPDDLKEDAASVIDAYGDLDHSALLNTVYYRHPAYARKRCLRKKGK